MNNVRLKEYLVEITKGTTPTTIGGEFLDEGVNFVKAECLNTGRIIDKESLSYISPEIHKKLNRSILKEGDLLFSIAGQLGKMAIVRKSDLPANTNQAVAILRIDTTKADVEFLYYYLSSKSFSTFINSQCAQSVQPNINLGQVGELPIVKFPSTYQKKISSVLSTLDSKIELNNRSNLELEAIAKTLYDYWFVQFDFPDKNGMPYKTSGGKMVWNEELKREIPEGWENGFFGDYAKLKGGFAFKSSWWTETGLPVIKIKDINEDYTLSLKNCSCVNEDKYGIAKNYEVHPGDVVIALTGATVGKYGIVTKSEKQVLVNQRVGFFKLGEMPLKKLPFLINSLNQEYFRKTVFVLASGAAQPNISTDQIDAIPLIIPKGEIIKRYNESCKSFYEVIIKNQTENQKLTELRDWLLPMLMNGQVKVN
jgi:type I restriction enzyme S subunit